MLDAGDLYCGLELIHAPSGRRVSIVFGRNMNLEDLDELVRRMDAGEPDREPTPAALVSFMDMNAPPEGTRSAAEPEWVRGATGEKFPLVPIAELVMPPRNCNVQRAGEKVPCATSFVPDSPNLETCPACAARYQAEAEAHRRKYVRENRKRVRAARLAMPNMYATLRAAYRRKEVFYVIEHVSRSGMSRNITLHATRTVKRDVRIGEESDGEGGTRGVYVKRGRAELCIVWPDSEPTDARDVAERLGRTPESITPADVRAMQKAWRDAFGRTGFNYEKRAFRIGGCGMDMVFALMDNLGHVFGLKDAGNVCRRSSLTRS